MVIMAILFSFRLDAECFSSNSQALHRLFSGFCFSTTVHYNMSRYPNDDFILNYVWKKEQLSHLQLVLRCPSPLRLRRTSVYDPEQHESNSPTRISARS